MKQLLKINAMMQGFESATNTFKELNAIYNVFDMEVFEDELPEMRKLVKDKLKLINKLNRPCTIERRSVEILIHKEIRPSLNKIFGDVPDVNTQNFFQEAAYKLNVELSKDIQDWAGIIVYTVMIETMLNNNSSRKKEPNSVNINLENDVAARKQAYLTDISIMMTTMLNELEKKTTNNKDETLADLFNESENSLEQDKVNMNLESDLTAKELAYLTGLSEEQCLRFMQINSLSGDEALEAIDIFMQSLNENVAVPVEIAGCLRNAGIYTEMAGRLNAYNTMRGGVKGYGGFVFEEMHAADAAVKGANIKVLGDNSIADFIVKDASGKETLIQAKAGYKPHQVDWSKYKNQTIVVDKGNEALAAEARAAGLKVQESAIFKDQANVVARAQQWESRVTGKATAPITGTAVSAHTAGLASAKLAARVGVSMKLGENIYDVVSGNKQFEDAAADVIVDGAVLVGGAYVTTAALTVAGTAATAAGAAIAGTAAGAVVTGAAGTAVAAVGSTAVGGAVLAGAGTAAAAVGTAVTAVATAPLAPVVAVGAAIGFVGKLISDRW